MKGQENKSVKSSPYLLGLLCIIPLVGAFVGIGLLLYGILKYKDKWLSIIGIAGILWTIIFYFLLYNMFEKSPKFINVKIELTKKVLNNLVKNIEFYKLTNGHYPDSLKQVEAIDKTSIIWDPLQKSKNDGWVYFMYEKIGEKYKHFSIGLDGIPETKDDIYPNLPDSTKNKIGLIR